MLRIAVCDDEELIRKYFQHMKKQLAEDFGSDVCVQTFPSGSALYGALSAGQNFDVIFLDIEMDKISGIEVGRYIRNDPKRETIQIVYISGKEGHAMELFDLRPLNFLIKPLCYEKIKEVLKTVQKLAQKGEYAFSYYIDREIHYIEVKDILYFESNNRRIIIHTVQGTDSYYGKLKDAAEELRTKDFLSIHKSFLVNYAHIIRFTYENVVMSDGKKLPVSKSNRQKVREWDGGVKTNVE